MAPSAPSSPWHGPGVGLAASSRTPRGRSPAGSQRAASCPGTGGRRPAELVEFVAPASPYASAARSLVNVPWQWRREIVAVADETEARVAVSRRRADAAIDRWPRGRSRLRRWCVRAGRIRAILGPRPRARRTEKTAAIPHSATRRDVATTRIRPGSRTAPARPGGRRAPSTRRRPLALMPTQFIDRYDLGPDDCVLVAAPSATRSASSTAFGSRWRPACPMVLLPRWDAAACAKLASARVHVRRGADAVPLRRRRARGEARARELAASRASCSAGGAPVPPALLRRARAAFRTRMRPRTTARRSAAA